MMGTRIKSAPDDRYNGPYKATRLWNDVIAAFRANVPCGRHRRFMRGYDNCFSGSSATDWLLQYLTTNRNFGSDVRREKAVSLLNKLYTAGIFEEVKVTKSMQHKPEVQVNRLYRLLPASPSKSKTTRLPLAPRNDVSLSHLLRNNADQNKKVESKKSSSKLVSSDTGNRRSRTAGTNTNENVEVKPKHQSCRVVPKVLSSLEINEVWKKMFIFRMKKALGVSRLADVLSEDLINGSFLMHNCLYLNRNGTVTNISQTDQLPHWVFSAMKCLARWPEHQEEGLPSYPGFEKDIFAVVKTYFLGLREPLIPFHLYDAITNVFVMASSRSTNQSDVYTSRERESIVKSLWTSASLENIIMDLTKKYCLLDGTGKFYEDENLQDEDWTNSFKTQDNVQFVYDKEMSQSTNNVKHEDSFSKDKHRLRRAYRQHLSRSANSSSVLPQKKANGLAIRKFGSTPNLKISKYETAFGPDNRTVTRVFYQNGVCTDYKHCDEEKESSSFSPIETHFSSSLEKLDGCDNPVNFERVRSLECVNFNEFRNNSDCNPISKSHGHFHRSKSFASRTDFEGDENHFFDERRNNYGFNSLQRRNNNIQDLNKSAEIAQRKGWWASQDGLSTNKRLEPVPERPTHHRHDTDEYHEDYYCSLPRNSKFYPTSNHSTHNSSHFSIDEDHTFNKKQIGTSPPLQSFPSPNYFDSSSPTDSITGFPGYRPASGYRPVLDASRERSISVTDLSPQSHNPLRTKSLSTLNRNNSRHITSTPMAPFHMNQVDSLGMLHSAVSLSGLTPFPGSDGRRGHPVHTHGFMSYPQTSLSEERAKTSLQLIMLLITPSNRRKLHMLFKMMVKMTANPNLCLDPSQTTRSLVLGTFYPAILRTEKEGDFDETLVLQLLSFMLDYYDDIFTPPNDFKNQVSERLKQMQQPKISYSPGENGPRRYCQKMSVADFEKESKAVSRQAMEELLENIIKDSHMQTKEKKKRLAQFQMTYPTIYHRRFPTPESEAQVFASSTRPKLKQPLIIKPINRLKGLRL